ncbi:hypothetical protein B0J14DRAFT_193954 [Halenospora varia]|nr:hypothetical protein B0J14DRAFT_193954 [Halenospora varia]
MEASHMTLSHNSIIRGFNSIYQLAPRLPSSDSIDFIGYCLAWHRFVEEHHLFEEVHFFPAIEEAVGEKGVMGKEVEEHAAFHAGLKSFKTYLTGLTNPSRDFDPTQLRGIMDGFSEPLYRHLEAEPQALLALSRFHSSTSDFDLVTIAKETGKKAVSLEFAVSVMPMFLGNMEVWEFEGGMWREFPDVPAWVRWVMRNMLPWWNRRWWRFMSCDKDGRRRRLVA